MVGVRRALLFSSIERYSTIILNFVLIAAVSRILKPDEIGVAALGATIVALSENVRDSPSAYLVQKLEVAREDVRAAFTVMLLITLGIVLILFVSAEIIGQLLHKDGLSYFLYVIALSLLPGCIERPIMALLRRDMAFHVFAAISIMSASVTLCVTVLLAYNGYSFMCFAWGALSGSTTAAFLALCFRPHAWMFRPTLGEARQVLRFNGYGTIGALLCAAYEMLPYAVLGRLSQYDGAGFYNRTITISRLPDKLNTGLISFMLPALSSIVRQGGDLGDAYLKAIRYITVIEWPLRVFLAIVAEPVVRIILGPQWHEIVPLVQIMSLALIFAAPQILTFPTLVAAGHLRDTVVVTLIWWPLAAIIISCSAFLGLSYLVLAAFVVTPLQTAVAMIFIQKRVHFTWRALAQAILPSVIVTLCSALGPALVFIASGFRVDLVLAVAAAIPFVVGWLVAVYYVQHPIWLEVQLLKRKLMPQSFLA